AQNRAVLSDEHVEGADAGLLLSQQGAIPVGELVEELVATVRDRSSEVGAVHQLEGQDRRGMAGTQLLQLGHRPTLPRWCAEATYDSAAGSQPQNRAHNNPRLEYEVGDASARHGRHGHVEY